MRQTLLLLMTVLLIGRWPAAGQQAKIKRLDGSTITSAEIDDTVTRVMRAANVPGVGVAIFNHGKVVYLKTYGVRDKDKNLPLADDTIMAGASFTNVAFGYLVMQLVEKRILELDKP